MKIFSRTLHNQDTYKRRMLFRVFSMRRWSNSRGVFYFVGCRRKVNTLKQILKISNFINEIFFKSSFKLAVKKKKNTSQWKSDLLFLDSVKYYVSVVPKHFLIYIDLLLCPFFKNSNGISYKSFLFHDKMFS